MPAKGQISIRPCAGGCGRQTRAGNVKRAQAPNTVTRAKDGKCSSCLKGSTPGWIRDVEVYPCKGDCGRLTRSSGMKKKDAPETVARAKDGKCKTCVNRELGIMPKHALKVVPTSDDKISQYRQDLESWLEKWRVRHVRAVRREAIASSQLQAGQGRQMVLQRPGSERGNRGTVGGVREIGERTARSSSAA